MEQEHVPARAAYRLREIAVHLVAGQAVEQDDCSVRAATAGQIKRRVQIDAVARETDNSKRGRELLVRQRIGHDRRRHLLRQRRVCCEWPETEDRGDDDDVGHRLTWRFLTTSVRVPAPMSSQRAANPLRGG